MSTKPLNDNIVGVIGVGVVGGALKSYLEGSGRQVRAFDPFLDLGDERALDEAELLFVCVPTPYDRLRGFDDSAVHDAIGRLTGSKTVVIKSTVLPGTTDNLQRAFPQHCFFFNPEFLREATAPSDFLRPDRQLLGYTAASRHLAECVLALLPQAPYMAVMTAREAELTKYMTNTFLAVKVTFANEMADLAAALDVDYKVVRQAVAADPRIGASHLDVLDGGYRGYSGKCLPKDTKALLTLGERVGVPLGLLRTADAVNDVLLRNGHLAERTQTFVRAMPALSAPVELSEEAA